MRLLPPRHAIIASGLIAALITACTGAQGTPPPSEGATTDSPVSSDAGGELESTSLRIGYTTPDFAQVATVKWIQNLEALGLEVEANAFEDGSTLTRALVSGNLDLIITGALLDAILLVQETEEPVKVIFAERVATEYVMLARPEIEELSDLEGARLGTSGPGEISETLSRLALQRSGVDVDAVQIVQIGGTGARIAGLLSDQIDAGIAHAAEALTAVEEGGVKALMNIGEVVPTILQASVIAHDDWLSANPNLAQASVDAYFEAVRWAATNKDEYIELSKEHVEGLSDEVRSEAYDLFNEIEMFGVNGGIAPETVQNTVDIHKELGDLGDDAPPMEQWVDFTFVDDYLERHGEFER